MKIKVIGMLTLVFIVFYLLYLYNQDEFQNIRLGISGLVTSNEINTTIPRLSLFYPKDDNFTIYKENLTVAGKAYNAEIIYYKLNNDNEILEFVYPTFTKTFKLKEGENTISMRVCKNDSCSSQTTFKINYLKQVDQSNATQNQTYTSNQTSGSFTYTYNQTANQTIIIQEPPTNTKGSPILVFISFFKKIFGFQ